MNAEALDKSAEKAAGRRRLILLAQMIVGAVVGAAAAIAFAESGLDEHPGLRWADAVALVCALACALSGIAAFATAFNPGALGLMLRLDGPAGPSEQATYRLAGLVLIGSGMLIAGPVVAAWAGWPPIWAAAGLLVLLVVHTLGNAQVLRSADELFGRVTMEAGAWTFWLFQALFFIYAAGERLGLAPPLSAWDAMTLLFGLYLFVASCVAVRRGLG